MPNATSYELTNPFNLRLSGFIPPELRRHFRPTVVAALFNNDQLLLVQSGRDVTRSTWTMPQGGVEQETIRSALLGEVLEELDRPRAAVGNPVLLGCGSNPMPPERAGKDKYLIFVGAYLSEPHRINLKPDEVSEWCLVRSQYELWERMAYSAEHRPVKFGFTCAAVNKLHELGHVGWSCHEVMTQALAAE